MPNVHDKYMIQTDVDSNQVRHGVRTHNYTPYNNIFFLVVRGLFLTCFLLHVVPDDSSPTFTTSEGIYHSVLDYKANACHGCGFSFGSRCMTEYKDIKVSLYMTT